MDKLLNIIKQIKPENDLTQHNELVNEGILDSIDIVSIITEIEKEYGIELNPEDIDPDNFQSVTRMYEMVLRYL